LLFLGVFDLPAPLAWWFGIEPVPFRLPREFYIFRLLNNDLCRSIAHAWQCQPAQI
jgi:hypothetical protein